VPQAVVRAVRTLMCVGLHPFVLRTRLAVNCTLRSVIRRARGVCRKRWCIISSDSIASFETVSSPEFHS
jgi:hypothetical protein